MTLLRTSSLVALALTAGLVTACAKEAPKNPPPSGTANDTASGQMSQAQMTQMMAPQTPPTPTSQTKNGITRVDPSLVCMVTNKYMGGKPQIPVKVEGETYFGCCPMCKQRLVNEPTIRTAVDPVTGQSVDKASAVVAYDAAGKVLYFANADDLGKYQSQPH